MPQLALLEPVRSLARSGRDLGRFYACYAQNRTLKKRVLEARTPDDLYTIGVDGFRLTQKRNEILPFIEFLNTEKPSVICEIGIFGGGTTFLLSHALPTVRATIGVDIHIRNASLLGYLKRPEQRLHLVRGSSYSPDTVARVERLLGARRLDVLFIDGDHTYAGVSADFFAYRPLVRDGGLIGFHDIVSDDMSRYGRQTTNWAGDVPRFWHELKSRLPASEFVEHQDQDGYGIGLLRNRAEVSIKPSDLA